MRRKGEDEGEGNDKGYEKISNEVMRSRWLNLKNNFLSFQRGEHCVPNNPLICLHYDSGYLRDSLGRGRNTMSKKSPSRIPKHFVEMKARQSPMGEKS